MAIELFEVPALNVEKAVRAVQEYIRELEELEARNKRARIDYITTKSS